MSHDNAQNIAHGNAAHRVHSVLRFFGALALTFAMAYAALVGAPMASGVLLAEYQETQRLNPPWGYMAAVSDEELAGMPLLDTGWPHGEASLGCAHILINLNTALLCVPSATVDECLMIPLEYLRFLAGCGLETGLDGRIRLIKYDRSYTIDPVSGSISVGGETWVPPMAPYEAHGLLFVPFRFYCNVLELDIEWRDACDVVLLHSPWVDPQSLAATIYALNAKLLAEPGILVAEDEQGLSYGQAMEMIVTFYYTSKDQTYTASGNLAVAGSVAADSAYPFGMQFYIPELDYISEGGIFTVHDRGSAIKGNKIDIFLPNEKSNDAQVNAALRRGRFAVTAYPVVSE